jgi:hypothetical protein
MVFLFLDTLFLSVPFILASIMSSWQFMNLVCHRCTVFELAFFLSWLIAIPTNSDFGTYEVVGCKLSQNIMCMCFVCGMFKS